MDLKCKVVEDLGILGGYIKALSSDQVLCLVENKWLESLLAENRIPQKFIQGDGLSEEKCHRFLNQVDAPIPHPWKGVIIQAVVKENLKTCRLIKTSPRLSPSSTDLSYSQLIHYVTETNYRNLWKQAWRKYSSMSAVPKHKHQELQPYSEVIREVIKRLFSCPIIGNGHCSSECDPSLNETIHPNMINIICAVECPTVFYLIFQRTEYSLHNCIMFSPAIFETSTIRSLFVVYQLLQVLCSIHNQGLFMGSICLSDIVVKQNLWLQVMPKIWKDLHCDTVESQSNHVPSFQPPTSSVCSTSSDASSFSRNIGLESFPKEKDAKQNQEVLSFLVERWVKGSLSNYDYLMELNKLAGRVMDNPKCHPVMPWIMDFSVPDGGWRDLTKSKFRLNKGDKQLDLIYESAVAASNNTTYGNVTNVLQDSATLIPHHTSEVLSDITYYVYKARRMPKTVLCEHVRQKWVPAEYPSTVERLQEWTPDECIPEFFSDPTIFYSVHPDLNDLGIPWWCDSPEDFVRKHRAALESEHTSERLHQWIDITFGYKLTGHPAVKSKNVCLPLVDQHTAVSNCGMVQLFQYPHPSKLNNSFCFGSSAPKTFRNVVPKVQDAKDSGDDETSSESSSKSSRWKVLRSKSMPSGPEQAKTETRPENQTVVLPKEYSPLAALIQFEVLYTFIARTKGARFPVETQNNADSELIHIYHHRSKDMLVLGCIIGEMSLASHLKAVPQGMSLEERYSVLMQLLRTNEYDIPRYFLQAMQLLLQCTPTWTTTALQTEKVLGERYPPVSNTGLPPPSAHQLLQPLIHTIPFPLYFNELYDFLQKLNVYTQEIEDAAISDTSFVVKQTLLSKLAKSKIRFAAEKLLSLLPKVNFEAIDLLTPYLQEMFENQYTSLLCTWNLFGLVSLYLGPQQTARKLLKTLTKVFDADAPSSKHIKLYHRSFLLQLIVRLGLQTFLTHFITILIEAVGGSKDYLPVTAQSEDVDLTPSDFASVQPNCHHHSSKFHHLIQEEELNVCDTTLDYCSVYRDDSSHPDMQLQSESFMEKDPEIFDFDEVSEGYEKTQKELEQSGEALHHSVGETQETPFPCQDEVFEHVVTIDDDDITSMPDEPEVQDDLGSPVSNLKPCSKASVYSHSAPNLLSPLSQWSSVCGESQNFEKVDAEYGEKILNSSAKEVMLSDKSCNSKNRFNISDVASESVLWLSHRLGPVLTARYVTRNLLRMLSLCYDGQEKREVLTDIQSNMEAVSCLSICQRWVVGDKHASKVLMCLSQVAALYGEQYIMLQYLPHVADLLSSCKRRITATLEAGLLGAMALIHHIIPYLSDVTLMDNLQDVVIKDILYVGIRLISSLRLTFPGGGYIRMIVTCRLIDIIHLVGLRIGFEMTRKHLSSLLQRFFSCFDKVYDHRGEFRDLQDISSSGTSGSSPLKERALEEMREAFTPEIAYLSYIPFCKLAGGIHIEQTLKNDELIRHLCMLHDISMTCKASEDQSGRDNSSDNCGKTSYKTHHRVPSLGQDESFVSGVFGKNVILVGNRLDVQLGDDNHSLSANDELATNSDAAGTNKISDVPKYDINFLKRKMENTQRHLKGNWLAYWEHETGRSEKDHHFNFKQIKLQSFVGHTGTIRTIYVLDNENSFLTSSKDKTVKLWSLRSCGDGTVQTPCQWTYTQHRKSVFAVSFLDSLRLVGSCDSTVHIWDPFIGSCVKQLSKGSPVTVLTPMPAPNATFLAATTNSTVRFLDARTCRYMHEFKVSLGQTGLIRGLAVSPNGHWLAVGHSTGMVSVLDVRTGLIFGTWMAHEGEILQIKVFNNSYFVTSAMDQSLSVWLAEDTQAKCNLRGPLEPITSLCFYKGEVISGTTANRIGLHTSIDRKATYTSTRLRSDTFKGMLTAMAVLPLNRLLLLGADNGSVVLLS